jgi:hypothetical protein
LAKLVDTSTKPVDINITPIEMSDLEKKNTRGSDIKVKKYESEQMKVSK